MDIGILKARVWDKKNKRMLAVLSMSLASQEIVVDELDSNHQFPGVRTIYGNQADLMFAIGTQDKNGRDIYDQDFIRSRQRMGWRYEKIVWVGQEDNAQFIGWGVTHRNGDAEDAVPFTPSKARKCEVVGNNWTHCAPPIGSGRGPLIPRPELNRFAKPVHGLRPNSPHVM